MTNGEYCDYETFQAQCAPGEIIQMLSAEYGHIGVGKCVKADIGFLGCKADVIGIFDRICSGKQSCEMYVRDEQLRDTSPCVTGIAVYLEATYACVKGRPKFENFQNICIFIYYTRICYVVQT